MRVCHKSMTHPLLLFVNFSTYEHTIIAVIEVVTRNINFISANLFFNFIRLQIRILLCYILSYDKRNNAYRQHRVFAVNTLPLSLLIELHLRAITEPYFIFPKAIVFLLPVLPRLRCLQSLFFLILCILSECVFIYLK